MKLIPESWIIFKILKRYLFLAVLGCHCCSQLFLVVAIGDYSLAVVRDFSTRWLVLLQSMV